MGLLVTIVGGIAFAFLKMFMLETRDPNKPPVTTPVLCALTLVLVFESVHRVAAPLHAVLCCQSTFRSFINSSTQRPNSTYRTPRAD